MTTTDPMTPEALRDALVNEMHATKRGTLEWLPDGPVDGTWHDLMFRLDTLISAVRAEQAAEVERLRARLDWWWRRSQGDEVIIRDAGVMQEVVTDLRAELDVALAAIAPAPAATEPCP